MAVRRVLIALLWRMIILGFLLPFFACVGSLDSCVYAEVHFGIFRGLRTSTESHFDFEFFDSMNISDNFYRIINIRHALPPSTILSVIVHLFTRSVFLSTCVSRRIPMQSTFIVSLLATGDVHSNPGPALALACRYQQLPVLLCSPDIINVTTEPTSGDGHCFAHALRAAIVTYMHTSIPYDLLLHFLSNEFDAHFDTYQQFTSVSTERLRSQAKDYFSRKIYNNEFGDILPLVASNTFCIRIIICTSISQCLNEFTTVPCQYR